MPPLSFAHPWLVWCGVATAAMPVVVHVLMRPRAARVPLSTLPLVREVIEQRRVWRRVRDGVVLSLRTLAVLVLALAIARPQFGTQPVVSDRTAGDALRVVVLDVSQSMAATEQGIPAIARARAIAAEHLRYRPGLAANLVVAGAGSRTVLEQEGQDFAALHDALSHCEALPQRIDASGAIRLAARVLTPATEQDARRRELVVVSDFQRAAWGQVDFSPLPAGTQIQLESVASPQQPENLALLSAACQPAATGGKGARLEIQVGNFSPAPRQVAIDVSMGEAIYRLGGECPANRTVVLTEEIELRQTGWLVGEARLVGVEDALTADNARAFAVLIREKPAYALVTRQPAGLRGSSSHCLERAISEGCAAKQAKAKSPPAVLRMDPSSLTAAALAPVDLVALDHPGALSEGAVRLLASLVRHGRPILYVVGEGADAMNLQRLAEAVGNEWQLPVEFHPRVAGEVHQDLLWTMVRNDRPPLNVLGDGVDALKRRLRFAGGLISRPHAGGNPEDVLARYHDGSACLVLSVAGAGSLAVFNADLAASNLPETPVFVPLVGTLLEGMLACHDRQPVAVCGEPLEFHLPAGAGPVGGLRIVGPPGGGGSGELVQESAGAVWRWRCPSIPGGYRIQRGDHTVFSLAVQIPAEESRTESLAPAVLEHRLAAGRDVHYRAAQSRSSPDRLWSWLACASVVCLLGELITLLAFRS